MYAYSVQGQAGGLQLILPRKSVSLAKTVALPIPHRASTVTVSCRSILWLCLLMLGAGAVCSPFAQASDPSLYQEMRWRMIGPHRGGRTVGAAGVPEQGPLSDSLAALDLSLGELEGTSGAERRSRVLASGSTGGPAVPALRQVEAGLRSWTFCRKPMPLPHYRP
jgi:hypothetical protein